MQCTAAAQRRKLMQRCSLRCSLADASMCRTRHTRPLSLQHAALVRQSSAVGLLPPPPPMLPRSWSRRCVTGTPLSRGLEDLYGLLAFLQAAPYSNRHWWQRVLQRPYEEGSRAGGRKREGGGVFGWVGVC